MHNRLIYKFVLGFIAVVVVSFLGVSLFVSRLTHNQSLKDQERLLYQEANFIASDYAENYYEGSASLEDLKKQLKAVDMYVNCDVMLISLDGTIILNTGESAVNTLRDFDPTSVAPLNYMIDNFYGIYSEDHLSVFYQVSYSFTPRGYIVLSKPVSAIHREADSTFNFNYLTMLLVLTLTGVLLFLFVYYISRPLQKITAATAKYAKGDFSHKLKFHRNDEIGQLADSLDYMGSEINSLNEYQKKFIANVSHDFRSPLTSIKGYLEAMLDGTIPPELYEKYLNIVISETERLTKLTNNLLTINNVTDQGMILDKTEFDVVDIIKKTIETFEGTCTRKKIKFKLVFSSRNLYVLADQAKIQQVLYNLIDNAIKFSHSESSIIISATEKTDKIQLSIKDFGIGIPKDSIQKIWERFYKTDLSRGKDKKGTGLGLSIVKEIIAAHGEYIDVVSTEGVGTEFIFYLPKGKGVRPVEQPIPNQK